ncbi:MAG: MBL fold metallo-hydrolase [Pseudolabrys sp.]
MCRKRLAEGPRQWRCPGSCWRSTQRSAGQHFSSTPDHAWGLADGAPCPVYATDATWALLDHLPIRDRRKMPPGKAVTVGGVKFKAVPIQHSIRAPAVGYRVSIGSRSFFYAPDIAGLPNRKRALGGIQVFIGDGAVLTRSMVRTKAGQLIGHAPVTAQLDWCESAGVARAIFTHCGSGIVRGKARQLNVLVRRLGRLRGITAGLACDGDRLILARLSA